jgi:hypothetical protein
VTEDHKELTATIRFFFAKPPKLQNVSPDLTSVYNFIYENKDFPDMIRRDR